MKKHFAVFFLLLAGCAPDPTLEEESQQPLEETYAEGQPELMPDGTMGYVPSLLGMKVGVEMRNGRPFVKARLSCHDSRPKWIYNIRFQDATDRDLLSRPFCELASKGGVSTDFRRAGWEYGKELDGFVVLGRCLPLQIDHPYAATVYAWRGLGTTMFEIKADGGIRILEEECGP